MFGRIRKRRRTTSRNAAASRRNAKVPRALPSSVVFDQIDYRGEHMDLAVPIEAEVSLDEFGKVFILNEEAHVYGIGPTLEDAMDDFCGSFLLCYKAQSKYGPGAMGTAILRYAGWQDGE